MATLKEMQDAVKHYAAIGDVASVRELVEAIRDEQTRAFSALAQMDEVGPAEAVLIGAGRATDRLVKGGKQLWLHVKNDQEGLAKLKEEAAEEDRLYQPLQEKRPFATALGESLPALALPVGAATTLPKTMAAMAVAGGLPGALEYGTAEERAKKAALGAMAGAATPVAMKAVEAVGSGANAVLRDAAQPLTQRGRSRIVERTLARVAKDTPLAADRLRAAGELVPGSAPTAAQVAESGGIAALERAVKSAVPDVFTQRAREQSAARIRALRTVAGDDAALAAARAVRDDAAKRSYKHAFLAGVDQEMADALKPQIHALLEKPSIKAAMADATRMAQEEGLNITEFGSVQGLHFLKEALDDQISSLAKNPKMQRRVLETKNSLMKVLEDIAPEYKVAAERYARLSQPINRMEVGQKLLEKVEPAINDYGGLAGQTASTAARALRNADALAREATGFRGAKFRKIIEPQHAATINAIMRDLARSANAESLGRFSGPDTAQKLAMRRAPKDTALMAGDVFGLPRLLNPAHWMGNDLRVERQLAETLMSPQATAQALELGQLSSIRRLLARNKKTKALSDKTSATVENTLRKAPKVQAVLRATADKRRALPLVLPLTAAHATEDPVRSADELEAEYLGQ